MKNFKLLFMALMLSLVSLFGADTYYEQTVENTSWKQQAKIKLVDNNDSTYSLSARLTGTNGEIINSFSNAINIHDPHSHTVIINERFHRHTDVNTTFAEDAPAQSIDINVTDATGFAIGDYLHLQDGVVETNHPQITNITGTIFRLDRPIDNNFSTGDLVQKTIQSMDTNGTITSPISFNVVPPNDEVWHIMRILIEMTHGTAGDNGLFGDLTALTNGVLLRRYDGATGTYATFTAWKTNGDIVTDMYDVVYSARSGGGGSYGTNCRGSFYKTGAVVRLDGAAGDYLEILIQDDLSLLDSFTVKAQGHIEGR